MPGLTLSVFAAIWRDLWGNLHRCVYPGLYCSIIINHVSLGRRLSDMTLIKRSKDPCQISMEHAIVTIFHDHSNIRDCIVISVIPFDTIFQLDFNLNNCSNPVVLHENVVHWKYCLGQKNDVALLLINLTKASHVFSEWPDHIRIPCLWHIKTNT